MAKNLGVFIKYARVQTAVHPGIKEDDILAFFENLSTLLNSGVALMRAIALAIEQCESQKLVKVLREVSKKVAGGKALYDSMSEYPNIFAFQWLQVIRTGEQSGQLGRLLIQLNTSIKKSSAITGKVKSALIYPAIMLCVAIAAIFIMLWKVIPTFAKMFEDSGQKLPAITQFMVDASTFVQKYGIRMIVIIGIAAFLFKKFIATDFGSRQWNSLLMAIPVVGELQVQSAQVQFAASMALLMKSGMPMLSALESTQQGFRENPIYADIIGDILRKVSAGGTLGGAMENTGFFTKMTVGMTKMGEESGKLSDTFELINNYYEDKVTVLAMRATGLLEPVIVIGMGVLVAGMLGAIYLPMFQISSGGA
ncbi:MAG: type II secretion system F family protein [Elusimicrobiaceae bacterium]|nr:type II secretion system F family protein [Elusimicrobiaceae bacterium]